MVSWLYASSFCEEAFSNEYFIIRKGLSSGQGDRVEYY